MRVKISYGVELEEIPEHVDVIGQSALIELRLALQQLDKALENVQECDRDYGTVLNMMDKVRHKLNKSDLIISDVQNILEGLNNYYNGEENV
jgi:hypothetical protein